MRRLGDRLHVFESHTDEVLHLAWSPHNSGVFASASSDRRINIWDLAQIGAEQTPDDQEDGPPELMFVHGGRHFRFEMSISGVSQKMTYRPYLPPSGLLLGTGDWGELDSSKHI